MFFDSHMVHIECAFYNRFQHAGSICHRNTSAFNSIDLYNHLTPVLIVFIYKKHTKIRLRRKMSVLAVTV